MKGYAIALAICLAQPAAAASAAGDLKAIEQAEHRLAEISDPSGFKDVYTADAVLYDGLLPGVFRGIDAITRSFAEQLQGVKSVRTDFLELRIENSGDLGIAYSLQRIHVAMNDGGKREIIARVTDIFRRQQGQWRVTHQHISYPIDPKTGQGQFSFDPEQAR